MTVNEYKNRLVDTAKLMEKYGPRNVENVMICITEQRTPDKRDLHVHIPLTTERIEKVLDAIHGEHIQRYAQENLPLKNE